MNEAEVIETSRFKNEAVEHSSSLSKTVVESIIQVNQTKER